MCKACYICPTYCQVRTGHPLRCIWCNEDYNIITEHWFHHSPAMGYWQELITARLNEHEAHLDDIIFHSKHLGSRGIEYLTALFNYSVTSCRIPSIWKSSIVIPIPKPGKDCSLSTSYRHISLLCPTAKVMEALLLPTMNRHLLLSADQHGFRPGHSTTSALPQLTNDIATGFNQRKPPHRTVCVGVDLTAAFDTVNHNVLLSKIVRSTLPGATCRWLSNYLRGRQSVTSCRGVQSKAKIVHTDIPQGSKMSSTLISFS